VQIAHVVRVEGGLMDEDARARRTEDYTRAELRVPSLGLVLRPREPGVVGAFPFDVDVVHVLTAHNPGAERPGPAENAARQDRLVADLRRRGLRYWPAVAGAADGAHAEASVVVAGLGDDEARAVGAAWGQDAVFRWSRGAWSVVACDDAASVDLGWEIEVDA
jgi:Protein of unknown function (DUF3293)